MFDIPYYKVLKEYLHFLGQYPDQENGTRNIIVTVIVISILSILVPTSLEVYTSICDKNMDGVLECLPHLGASATSVVMVLNIHFNRENFEKMYEFVAKEWEQLKLNNELHVLEEITVHGSKMARLYRRALLSCLILYMMVPLIFPILDIVLPLNDTRPRQQMLRVNYLIFDGDEYFFYVYLHLAWGSFVTVVAVLTIDSLYMLIIHHTSGLFAVCGYNVKKATSDQSLFIDEATLERYTYQQLKNCIITHDRAIQFYSILSKSSRISYLLQVGLTMMGISVTAVQIVVNLDRPEEAIKSAAFFSAKQFHLFMLSLPGQELLDRCSEMTDNIYGSTWHRIPVKVQKMLYLMQIRSEKPCALTAGGIYEMNMENFGTTFKTCMSYFTMIMSLKE